MAKHFLRPDTYAVWSKDENIRFSSTSGGAFTEFAKVIISDGGMVAGARYNSRCTVEHCLIDSETELENLRQSKYMSSDPGNIYKSVKNSLEMGQLVGFCGSPCQVAGLLLFLGKDYDNLVTMDFICRGMNSPKAFKAWLSEIEKEEDCKATKVWFKYKDGGWKSSPRRVRIDFEDGHYVVKEGDDNSFMSGYLSYNLYMRPSCGNCKTKNFPRPGDITLADYWGIEKRLDDDCGTSMVLINTEKGRKLFDRIKDSVIFYECDFGTIFAENPMLTASAEISRNSHNFLTALDTLSFSEALKKYSKDDLAFIKRIIRKIKKFIKKIGKA